MIWITTPFLMALQYFSADQPIFTSFDRNPRNFCISLLILALAFPFLTWVFNSLYSIFDSVINRLCVKKPRDRDAFDGAFCLSIVLNFITLTRPRQPRIPGRPTNCCRGLAWVCLDWLLTLLSTFWYLLSPHRCIFFSHGPLYPNNHKVHETAKLYLCNIAPCSSVLNETYARTRRSWVLHLIVGQGSKVWMIALPISIIKTLETRT
jgi:hypothetical protein